MSPNRNLWTLGSVLLVIGLTILASAPNGWAQGTHKILYKFTGGKDGSQPVGSLIFDKSGNLYGTTCCGGGSRQGDGTVFKLTPSQEGWTESVLHSFSGEKDGSVPLAGVVFDANGNLYGTTSNGGNSNCAFGCGVVFELTPNSEGGWTESVLHRFAGDGRDGASPTGELTFDSAGKLYGTTAKGGAHGFGTVFRLIPLSDGTWAENVLYDFSGGNDGAYPSANVIIDAKSNLYGTTSYGGIDNVGVVFKLTPAKGMWTISVLHSFTGADGKEPFGTLSMDKAGSLYGTTFAGGHSRHGTVFKLAYSNSIWKETLLHSFVGQDGATPTGGVSFDSSGNLYGTTALGGNLSLCSLQGCGLVFKLTRTSKGGWQETPLWVFGDNPGANPDGGVIFDGAGNLYGTTSGDSTTTFGTVFEVAR